MDKKEGEVYIKILVFCSLLAVIIIGFIVSFFRQQRKLNKEKIKAEINTSEEIKRKFATDLHDDLGPILATIKIYVNALSQDDIEDKNLIKNLNEYLDLGISRVKIIANGLMPNTLQRKDFISAIQEYINTIKSYVPFSIDFYCNVETLNLKDEAKLNLYRVLQEIITNTIKYAGATQLRIRIEKKDNQLLIETIDNGVGFVYKDHNYTSSGYGISSIKSRIEIMEGVISIFSKPGEGTKYILTLPMKKICD